MFPTHRGAFLSFPMSGSSPSTPCRSDIIYLCLSKKTNIMNSDETKVAGMEKGHRHACCPRSGIVRLRTSEKNRKGFNETRTAQTFLIKHQIQADEAEIAQPGKTQAWKACGRMPSGVQISLSAPFILISVRRPLGAAVRPGFEELPCGPRLWHIERFRIGGHAGRMFCIP